MADHPVITVLIKLSSQDYKCRTIASRARSILMFGISGGRSYDWVRSVHFK